jgi:F-box and WD-40 domain protein 1/11
MSTLSIKSFTSAAVSDPATVLETSVLLYASRDSSIYTHGNDSGHALDEFKLIDFITQLPYELALHILSFVDVVTLCRLSLVSRAWYPLVNDDLLWRSLFRRQAHFLIRPPELIINHPAQRRQLLGNTKKRAPPTTKLPAEYPGYKKQYMVHHKLDERWTNGSLQAGFLNGHEDSVYCVQFDKSKIVTGSRDKTIKVWNPKSGACTKTIKAHEASVLCLRYDDAYMVTGSSDTTAWIWTLPSFTKCVQLVGHAAGVLDVCFDKERVVTCSKDYTIRVWKLADGSLERVLVGHKGPVNAVQMANGMIASASGDATVRIWNVETGACIRKLTGHERGLACVRFDGVHIVSGSNDRTIKVWDVETGECIQTLVGHTKLVRTLWFNERWIVSGSYDSTVKVWDRQSGSILLDLKNGHNGWILDVQFDSTRIISTDQERRIVVWDFAYGLDTSFIG